MDPFHQMCYPHPNSYRHQALVIFAQYLFTWTWDRGPGTEEEYHLALLL